MKGAVALDRLGIGGFTEAILAMMVVTVAVMLLTISLALGVADVDRLEEDRALIERASELSVSVREDILLWRGGNLIWAGLEKRSLLPYELPVGCRGYLIGVDDLADGAEWSMTRGNVTGTEVTVLVDRTPITILSPDGTIDAGLLTIEAW